MIITATDFVGNFSIPDENPFLQDDNLTFIEAKEKSYLKKFLGTGSYNELINNISSEKWQKLILGFDYQEENYFYSIKGLKEMLIAFVYYEITKESQTSNSAVGFIKSETENSTPDNVYNQQQKIFESYNLGLGIYNNLSVWIYSNNDQEKKTASSIVDNGDGTYTFNISDTGNILNYSIIETNNGYYVVSDLVDNTSFKITEATGKTFTNNFEFYKYGNLITQHLRFKNIINY